MFVERVVESLESVADTRGMRNQYLKRSSFGLLMLDLWIIWRGVLVFVKGGEH
jgi:hypothetical protein